MRSAPHQTPEVFAVTADGGSGLTNKQTRGRSFVSPSPGVRVRSEVADDPGVLAEAALLACPQPGVLTDLTAAREWGLPLPSWLHASIPPVSVGVAAGSSHSRRSGVRGRRLDLPDVHLAVVRGKPITTPARTWLDCAAELPFLDGRSASPGESLTRYALVSGGVPRPECNVDVIVDGEWLATVDFLWRDARIIVEYDGIVHLSEEQRRYDAARRNLLQEAGYYVIVFTARDLKHPEQMRVTVLAALRRAR